jgi:V/A-type H+-transporting ATPase subunit I
LQQRRIIEHLEQTASEIRRHESEARTLLKDTEMGQARANIQTLEWFLDHAPGLLERHQLCHITGWCAGSDPNCLQDALTRAGIQAVVRFPEPPAPAAAPVDLLTRWWTLPFRPFLRLWGIPGQAEVDPSGLLALIVPLLFGYMFPDIGHGLVLIIAGVLATRHWPEARFLIPCGLSAMAFGAVFGEVFGFEGVIEPLWLHPLEAPLDVLTVPLAFGMLLIVVGQLFAGIEAHWRGELASWLRVDAAVAILYLSLPVAWWLPWVQWLSAAALLHYFLGSVTTAHEPRWKAFLLAAGRLLLSLFELTMNTLSFARVGAFALAHAALSEAILRLADAVSQPMLWGLTIALGSVFGIVMEGLLVYVQTTRLVLFEFFIQFKRAEGRLLRVTRPPPAPTRPS